MEVADATAVPALKRVETKWTLTSTMLSVQLNSVAAGMIDCRSEVQFRLSVVTVPNARPFTDRDDRYIQLA